MRVLTGKVYRRGTTLFGAMLLSVLTLKTACAIELPTGFSDEAIADEFDTPVAMTPLPDGRIVVLEQFNGKVFLVNPDNSKQRSLLYTFTDVNTASGNERGLLGVAADPQFVTNGYLYFYYSAKGNHSQITRLTFNNAKSLVAPESRLEILSDIPDDAWNHNGGTLRFGPDSMLYVSIGDDATSCLAQDTSDLRGSILRLDVRLTTAEEAKMKTSDEASKSILAPANNPFQQNQGDNAGLIYVFGLRNPFRFDIDPQNGDMLIADVGLLDFEEIDYVPYTTGGGGNFGWPFFEGPAPRAEPGCKKNSQTKYIQPVAFYDRTGYVASVISLCIYRPSAINGAKGKYVWPKEYYGDYFYLDYFQGFVRRLKPDKQGRWRNPTLVAGQPDSLNWATNLKSVPDAFVGSDGALYYLRQFDDNYSPKSGQLRRIVFRNQTRKGQ